MAYEDSRPCKTPNPERDAEIEELLNTPEENLLEGPELDALVGEIGITRNSGENDNSLRKRAALHELNGDLVKCLESTLSKRRGDWTEDEQYLHQVFEAESVEEREKFIADYIDREEVTKQNRMDAFSSRIHFPDTCVLQNEFREVMIWLLSSMASWERDPCLGCTHCMLGKLVDENIGAAAADEADGEEAAKE